VAQGKPPSLPARREFIAALKRATRPVSRAAYHAKRNLAPPALSGRVRRDTVNVLQWRSEMAHGTVKWFNSQKGYGFIQPQGGGKDVFVHISAVERAGLSSLNEGQAIEYEEVANKGKNISRKSEGSTLILLRAKY
jgi:cold shock protein